MSTDFDQREFGKLINRVDNLTEKLEHYAISMDAFTEAVHQRMGEHDRRINSIDSLRLVGLAAIKGSAYTALVIMLLAANGLWDLIKLAGSKFLGT